MTRWTQADVDRVKLRQGAKAKPSKYRNKRVAIGGFVFDSKREADHWLVLTLRQKAGDIEALARQVRYPLFVKALHTYGSPYDGIEIGVYVADFFYIEHTPRGNVERVVDVKGVRTELFNWKAKHFEAQYGFPITLV